MFENVLGQSAADQLIQDIKAGALAQAMLFSGTPASAKGTAALELGRVLSCEAGPASWNCDCPSCSRHRLLLHPDLLCLGPRHFSAEIAASAGAFRRENGSPLSKILFIRSLRKLLSRFSPVLWEDEPKGKSISPLVSSLEEDLNELDTLTSDLSSSSKPEGRGDGNQAALARLVEGMVKNAFKLESDGLGEIIPIAQIRRAAIWSRLAPVGRGKLLLIENVDHMQEEARNSLLKLLEEPPGWVHCVLTSSRPGSLLPTMLSRLRPYRFGSRDAAIETEIIRRVFKDRFDSVEFNKVGIAKYLDSFLPVSGNTLEALAAFFAASVAYKAAMLSRRQGRSLPEQVVLLGKASAPRAEAAGLGRPKEDSAALIALINEKAEKFEIRSLFSSFLFCLLEQVSLSQRQDASGEDGTNPILPSIEYNEMWRKCSNWAETAAGVYKLKSSQVLEKLFTDLSRGMAEL
jgi:DNA polymerase-3 subunit gamma/tau